MRSKLNRALTSLLLLLLCLASRAHAQSCAVPLLKFGPISPVHGFPLYYQDSTLLGLQPCLDTVCDPALALPDPNKPISFPNNFPVETFYHRAISKLTGPNGETGLLTLALEGSFANGVVAQAGDQVVFTRVRVRATGLQPGGTYTITHPYGVETLQASDATAAIPGVINFTRDSARTPASAGIAAAFGPALTGDVGPFLHAASPPPPAGLIGNPGASQTVTGSPCGQNIFRIAGPGLGGGIETNQFTVLIGRIAPLCGNGVVDAGEDCDLAASNGAATNCCTATCTFATAGTACNDGNVCDVNGTCSGASDVCPVASFTTAACNDGDACTLTDSCNGAGTCVGTNPVVCPTPDQCHTAGTCDPATGVCSNPAKADGTSCTDNNACTHTDACQGGVCVGTNAVVCTAQDQCHFAGTCDPASGVCSNPPKDDGTSCSDGNACTTGDACSAGACVGGAAPNCDDGNPCTDDFCDPVKGCVHVNNTASCDDGNACTTNDTCHAGTCVGGPPPDCNDDNVCTADSCNPASGCVHTNVPGSCDDGNACTSNDQCSAGVCVGGPALSCDDGNACTADSCDPAAGCKHSNVTDGTTCSDGNACTLSDTCQAGVCTGASPVVCTPLDQCHAAGTCNPATGTCSNPEKPNGSTCDDGNACTQSDTCRAGTCTGANPVVCAASDQCHDAGTCNPATGTCSNPAKPNGATCNDGDACTQTDTCQSGACTGTNPVVCAASDQCHTAGTCNPTTGQCSNPTKANGTSCDDGLFCTVSDSCSDGVCGGAPRNCSGAANQCNVGVCNESTNACEPEPKTDGTTCSDGNSCTQSDTCQSGVCVGANPVVCTAPDDCHSAGTCDPSTGTCSHPLKANGTLCSDGDACTQTDTCQHGFCIGVNPVTCTASDQCHDAGVCDPATGTCSNPAKTNGSACTDGNACTQTDVCEAGVCTGTNPVACTASDQCHDAGVCNPANGTCSNPAKANGSACTDGDACTQTDTCQAGACVGKNPVVCTASDQCHIAGVCDPASGVCSNPDKADGSACTDGDACTQTDTCQAGLCTGTNPVTCTASDQCHVAGVCNPASGTCSNPAKANGSTCSDGNACTQTDTCQAGACKGTNPVTCTASDQCHVAGVCDPANGTCSNPAKANGSTCTDGDACTQTDTCHAGACVGANPVLCAALDQCHVAGVCNPASGVCSNPDKADGVACDDGDACTRADSCQAGTCTGANPVVCEALDQCHDAGTCDPSTGICSDPDKADGTACDDSLFCTVSDTCSAGVCGGAARDCSAFADQCNDGTCNEAAARCEATPKANGTACDDGSACSQTDTCEAGRCLGGNPVVCTAQDACHMAGFCDPATGACSNPPMAPCDDGDRCTADSCDPVAGCVFQPLTGLDSATCLMPLDLCQPMPAAVAKLMKEAETLIAEAGKASKHARAKKLIERAQHALKRAAKKASKLAKKKKHHLDPACAAALNHNLLEVGKRLALVRKSL